MSFLRKNHTSTRSSKLKLIKIRILTAFFTSCQMRFSVVPLVLLFLILSNLFLQTCQAFLDFFDVGRPGIAVFGWIDQRPYVMKRLLHHMVRNVRFCVVARWNLTFVWFQAVVDFGVVHFLLVFGWIWIGSRRICINRITDN